MAWSLCLPYNSTHSREIPLPGLSILQHLLVLLVVLVLSNVALGLQCNVCINADIKADCHLNQEECRPEFVCFVETSIVDKYKSTYGGLTTLKIYRMGCNHYSMCRDHTSHGASAYGYAHMHTTCCCTDRCELPDGVGRGDYNNCPLVWDNYTMTNGATSTRHQHRHRYRSLVMLLCAGIVLQQAATASVVGVIV